MADVDDEVEQIEQELAALQGRLTSARRKKAMGILDGLESSVEALGDLVDLYDQLDDDGRASVARFHNRVQERFADMGLPPAVEPVKRTKMARPVVELQG